MNDYINNITCIGSGTIGSSWATGFLMNGRKVHVYDVSNQQLESSKNFVLENLEFLEGKKALGKESVNEVFKRISFTTDFEKAVRDSDFIQESGPEKYEIKKSILSDVDLFAPKDAIFASSTSGLLITKIAEKSQHPERCIGAHPYNPPHLIPLVEITKGEKTAQGVIDKAFEFYTSIGKEPVMLNKESLGFIGNRLSFALYRELITMVLNGCCSVEDIDKVVTYGIGMRWAVLGPAMLYDLGAGDAGIRGMSKLDSTLNMVFEDLSNMNYMPKDWYDVAEKGLAEEKENLPEHVGNTRPDIARFRDDMLVELLKLQKKVTVSR